MSYKLTQSVIDTVGIPVIAKAVLLILARHARDDGTNSKCPSVQTIADKAGMSDKCARNALRALENDGWIKAISDKSGGRSKATSYAIAIERLGPPETRNDVPPMASETRHEVPPNGLDTQHDVPGFSSESRNDVPGIDDKRRNVVPKKAERRSAEYVNEETLQSKNVDAPHCADAREVGGQVVLLTTIPLTKENKATVERWLRDGYDPDLDILPAIANTMATTRYPVDQIRKFGFFTSDIEAWRLRRLNPMDRPRLAVVRSNGRPLEPGAQAIVNLYAAMKTGMPS